MDAREMAAKDLRDIAWTLDALVKLTRCLLEPIADAGAMGAGEVTVTVKVDQNGEPMSPEHARRILDWVNDDEMQDDLRGWASAIERHGLVTLP